MLQLLKNIPHSETGDRAIESLEKLRHKQLQDLKLRPIRVDDEATPSVAGTSKEVDEPQITVSDEVKTDTKADDFPAVTYNFSRLCFKANKIEPLQDDQTFRVVTPDGVFQMTKAEFHRAFPKVVASKSYAEKGIYHYPAVPKSAMLYKLPE